MKTGLMTYNDFVINVINDNMMSLTDMWKADGSDMSKRPPEWLRQENTVSFIRRLAQSLKVGQDHFVESKRGGKNPGTFAHWQIALAYAKYLSHEFHMWANQVVKERFEEMADPDLGVTRSMERAAQAWKKQGKSDEWIESRLNGMLTRKLFSSKVMGAGCDSHDLAAATDEVYLGLVGARAQILKAHRGVPQRKSAREAMDRVELCALQAVEEQVVELIGEGIHGRRAVLAVCRDGGSIMGEALHKLKKLSKKSAEVK